MAGLPGSPPTDVYGAYSAVVAHGWSGTVTPTLAGYTFSLPSRDYANVTSSQTENYTATLVSHAISGTVLLNGAGLQGVVIAGLPGNPRDKRLGRVRRDR